MATAIKLSAPTPAEKAEMIRRFFPALLPTFEIEVGYWEAPSMSDRAAEPHHVTAHQDQGGPIERRCNCLSRVRCTHVELVDQITSGKLVHGETLHYSGMSDAEFNARFGPVMKSRVA